MHVLFETDDKFDETTRIQRIELVADQFVDEQFLAALGRIVQTGGGKLVAIGSDGLRASVNFKSAKAAGT